MNHNLLPAPLTLSGRSAQAVDSRERLADGPLLFAVVPDEGTKLDGVLSLNDLHRACERLKATISTFEREGYAASGC